MPPSRSELEAMADELGYVGEERAAFVGDVTPTPKPKAVASPKPTATTPTTSAPKAATVAAKPKEPAKVTAFVDEPWPEYGPPAPATTPKPREPGVGPRVAAGMEPLPSPLMAKVAGVAGNVASKVYDARMALDGETPMLRDRVEDIAGFNRVMGNVEATRAADAQARMATAAATQPTAPKPTPAPQPTAAPKPAPAPATVSGGVTLQQAIDGLRMMGVPQATIEAELQKGTDGQRNVIDAYRNRTEK
jgi:hypothetical protein